MISAAELRSVWWTAAGKRFATPEQAWEALASYLAVELTVENIIRRRFRAIIDEHFGPCP